MGSASVKVTIPENFGFARSEKLSRILSAGLTEKRRVFLLSLDPLKEELGERWTTRSEQIWGTLERALTKRMPPPDVVVRIDDVHVVAGISTGTVQEAQALCLQILHSILSYFLGHDATKEVSISEVTGVKGDIIVAEKVDLSEWDVVVKATPQMVADVAAALEAEGETASAPVGASLSLSASSATAAPSAAQPSLVTVKPPRKVVLPPNENQPAESWRPPLAGRRYSHNFVSARRGPVRINFEIVPVWRLDQEAVSAFYIRRDLPSSLGSFDDFDREVIDHRLIDIMIPLLEEYRREGGMFALIVPGTMTTAAARRPRTTLISRCEPVFEIMRRALVAQVDGFGEGIPAGRVSEMAAMMKPFFSVLTAGIRDNIEADTVIADWAFQGIGIEASGMTEQRLHSLVTRARVRTPNLMVHGLQPGTDTQPLKALGVSHVSYLPEGTVLDRASKSNRNR